MLTDTEYLVAWVVYSLAAIGFVAVIWRVLVLLGFRVVKKVTVGLVLALLLTPWTVSVDAERLAPALFVGIFDATLQQDTAMYRAFFPLSLSLMVVVLMLCAEHFVSKKKP
ncbi:hypothetical protein A9Q99_27040 [Gammaproteobacteria bacterium 45_16_T64]|nr:hypothetical protein A9Q99_27040 [Gammaproteobacteria bacterium 45_16_T64]